MPKKNQLDISKITDYLYIAAHPAGENAGDIGDLGVRLVINMIWHRPAIEYSQPPFELLTLRSFDSPILPIPIGYLKRGATKAEDYIKNGDSVLTYCRQGRHRSVAMAASILITQGYSADEAMDLLEAQREVADPYAGHIARVIRKFEDVWLTEIAEKSGEEE